METLKFRQHPGGANALVKTINILLLMSLCFHAVSLLFAIANLFMDKVGLHAISRIGTKAFEHGMEFSMLRKTGYLNYDNANVIEWILLPRLNSDILSTLISFAVVYYAYRIFTEINLLQPFYKDISIWMVRLYQVMIIGLVFLMLRSWYLSWLIGGLTAQEYTSNVISSVGDYISIGTIAIVYIIVQVYKKGVSLQEEQNLVV